LKLKKNIHQNIEGKEKVFFLILIISNRFLPNSNDVKEYDPTSVATNSQQSKYRLLFDEEKVMTE
jgi:hypothetical protein